MATTQEERDLEDELAIQRVILSSLDGETFDGVENERQEARDRIVKLQRQLRAFRASSGAASTQGSVHTDRTQPSTPSTSARRHESQVMEAPGSGNDIWSPSGSGSLASRIRKRNYHATSLGLANEHQSKSRRTTPTRASPTAQSSISSQSSEIIDLTGLNDGEEASDYVARVKREEDRRAQERRDREYAMSLSGRRDPSHSPQPRLADAFGHLMATQRANVYSPQNRPNDDGFFASQPLHVDSSRTQSRQVGGTDPSSDMPRFPGHYDPTWDDVQIIDPPPAALSRMANLPSYPAGSHPPTQVASAHGLAGLARVLPDAHPGGNGGPYNPFTHTGLAAVPNRVPKLNGNQSPDSSMRSRVNRSAMHAQTVEDTLAIQHRPAPSRPTRADMPSWSNYRAQMLAGTLNGTLSTIINRTSAYDFVNRNDAYGNPLPSQLTSYIDETDPYGDPALTQKELDELLHNIEPDVAVPKGLQGITPDALTTPLYKHQEVALTWMKKMEEGTNKGGILADDMGLGKTISTLALIHERKSNSRPKTNLIVAPVALMRQWEEEIKRKTKGTHSLSVLLYHGKKSSTDEMMRYDVVLTTYGTLAAELKRLEKWKEEHKHREQDLNSSELAVKCPMLHPTKAKFHRVILDEAQCIKNKETQTAKACHQLRAQYRWCLTGTPMMNGVVELFSLLKFLQIKPYNHWNSFRQTFGVLFGKRGDSKSTAMRRLRVLLKAILLRRKKDSLLDGKPIVELPEKTEEVSHAELSVEERDFYTQLESRSQVIFNKYLREGSVGKNYANVLVLLLRLRQACCHPHLNLDVDDAAPAVDDAMLDRVGRLASSTVDRIKQIEAFECPVCYDVMTSPSFFFPCGHDCCRGCLTRLVDTAAQNNIQAGNESSKAQCITCRSDFDPKECFSYEAFQRIHMPTEHAKRLAAAEAAGSGDSEDSEDDSNSEVDSEEEDSEEVDAKGNLRGFVVDSVDEELDGNGAFGLAKGRSLRESADPNDSHSNKSDETKIEDDVKEEVHGEIKGEGEASTGLEFVPNQAPSTNDRSAQLTDSAVPEANEEMPTEKKKKKRKSKGKGKAKASDIKPSMLKALRTESFKNRKAYNKYMAYLRQTWLPSAKVDECIRLLKEFQQDGQKTIIFSQWTLLLDLIEVAMSHCFDKKPLRYDGSMSAAERAIAAQDFRDRKDCKVLLVSLRAGNAGLNLTAASRVIIMDPFWNPYIEMQAVDRAYRIGQKNEVKVFRILTQETVEDRIVELQNRKKEMVEAALDENAGKQLGRLSVAELRYLFTGRR